MAEEPDQPRNSGLSSLPQQAERPDGLHSHQVVGTVKLLQEVPAHWPADGDERGLISGRTRLRACQFVVEILAPG